MGTFNFGHDKYITAKMGMLVPIQMHQDVLPGDVWKLKTSALVRLAPMAAPVMSKVRVKLHHWFVPNRLVWPNFPDFITGGADGLNASVFPTMSLTENTGESTLFDYLGIPPDCHNPTSVSALPIRAYQLIRNLFYRDQDLMTASVLSLADGVDSTTDRTLKAVPWDKDYFTVLRTAAMKGPDVTVPVSGGLGGTAPVTGIGKANRNYPTNAGAVYETGSATSTNYPNAALIDGDGADDSFYARGTAATSGLLDIRANMESEDIDYDDLYVRIPDMRVAAAMQRYQENRSRFGGNYVDYLNFLGVKYSDARLQRPEYLGGDQGIISMSEVLQQTPDSDAGDSTTGVGNMFGHGITAFGRQSIRYRAEEHGIIFTFMIVGPQAEYADGIHRGWLRRTKEDFWQRELEHIGQQEVTKREVMAKAAMGYDPSARFGWGDRYDDYRTAHGYPAVAGEMRTLLAQYHMARMVDPEAPVPYELNSSFVTADPTTRIYQATFEDQLWCKIQNFAKAKRLVSSNAKPIMF